MNATVDPDLLKLIQRHVHTLRTDVEQLTFEVQKDKERVSKALNNISISLEELEERVASVQREQEVMKQKQSALSNEMEDVHQRVARVEDKLSSSVLQENRGKCIYKDVSISLVIIIIIKNYYNYNYYYYYF